MLLKFEIYYLIMYFTLLSQAHQMWSFWVMPCLQTVVEFVLNLKVKNCVAIPGLSTCKSSGSGCTTACKWGIGCQKATNLWHIPRQNCDTCTKCTLLLVNETLPATHYTSYTHLRVCLKEIKDILDFKKQILQKAYFWSSLFWYYLYLYLLLPQQHLQISNTTKCSHAGCCK